MTSQADDVTQEFVSFWILIKMSAFSPRGDFNLQTKPRLLKGRVLLTRRGYIRTTGGTIYTIGRKVHFKPLGELIIHFGVMLI